MYLPSSSVDGEFTHKCLESAKLYCQLHRRYGLIYMWQLMTPMVSKQEDTITLVLIKSMRLSIKQYFLEHKVRPPYLVCNSIESNWIAVENYHFLYSSAIMLWLTRILQLNYCNRLWIASGPQPAILSRNLSSQLIPASVLSDNFLSFWNSGFFLPS